jgi:hypothetical protein
LTGKARLSGSDYVEHFDGYQYISAWYKLSATVEEWRFEGDYELRVEPDKGYRVVIRSANPAVTLTMVGTVSDTNRLVPVLPGGAADSISWVGYCFPVPCSLGGPTNDDADLIASGFTGAGRVGGSDNLDYFDGSNFHTAWYKSNIVPPEWRFEGTASEIDHLEPGRGYILTVKSGHAGFSLWTLGIPPDYSKSALVSKTRVAPTKKVMAQARRERRPDRVATAKRLLPEKVAEEKKSR